MHRVSELVGRAIVAAENGERIGTVSDVLLDPASQRVLGLVIAGGLLSGEHVLPISDVQTLGTDTVRPLWPTRRPQTYPLDDTVKALQDVDRGPARGKAIIRVAPAGGE